MNINQINKDDLIKAGAHFGHPVRKWNPNFKQFIVTKRNGIHIININSTIQYLNNAIEELSKIVLADGNILFVGTKNQAKDIVQYTADSCGMFYIIERWLGGTLTNFSTIKKSIKRLKMLEKDSHSIYSNLTKKEIGSFQREKIKLADLHRGIKDMKHLPAALFVIDANHEKIAVAEAKCLGIPVFGIVDTNTDPFRIDFPIPANDDSIKTIKLILNNISENLQDVLGKNNPTINDSNEENKDVQNENNSSIEINEQNDKTSDKIEEATN